MEPQNANLTNEKFKKIENNVYITAWMGEVFSSLIMIASALALQFRQHIVGYILDVLTTYEYSYTIEARELLTRIVIQISSICYGLALLNILVCTLLLIGVTKRCSLYFIPWLLFNGILFGVSIHLVLYFIITGIFMSLEVIIYTFLLFTIVLVICSRVFFDVFLLYKNIENIEEAEATATPKQIEHQVGLNGYFVPCQQVML